MARVQVGEHEAAQYLPTFSKMTSGSLGCQIAVKCPLIFFLNVLLVTGLSHVHKGLGAKVIYSGKRLILGAGVCPSVSFCSGAL